MKAKKCKRKSAFCLVDIPFEIDMQIFKIYQDGVPHKLNHIFKVVCLKRVCDKLQSGGLQEHPDSCYVGEGIMEESKEIHSFRQLTQSSIFVKVFFSVRKVVLQQVEQLAVMMGLSEETVERSPSDRKPQMC